MSKALKGALLSALVFPGLGEILLKSYARGFAFVVIDGACLVTIVRKAAQQAQALIDAIQTGVGAIDLGAISNSVNEAVARTQSRLVQAAQFLPVLFWVLRSQTPTGSERRRTRKEQTGRRKTWRADVGARCPGMPTSPCP